MALSELRRCVAWYGTMCNPRALHPALHDSAIVQGDISEADMVWHDTSVYDHGDGYKSTPFYVSCALKVRSERQLLLFQTTKYSFGLRIPLLQVLPGMGCFTTHASGTLDPPEVRNWRLHVIACIASMSALASKSTS
jgi:hypothetical protein